MCLHARAPNAAESKELSRWLKRPRNAVQMRRGQLISFSAQGMRVQELSTTLHLHEEYVRQLLRQYNEEGLASLRTRAHPGRPPALTPEDESVVVEIATMPPRAFGQPFNQWSLRKLTDCLVNRQMIPKVSHVTIGKVLKRHKVTYQRTRTWKASKDPDFAGKKNESTDSTGRRRRTRS
jgi:transposase